MTDIGTVVIFFINSIIIFLQNIWNKITSWYLKCYYVEYTNIYTSREFMFVLGGNVSDSHPLKIYWPYKTI